jgi:hypothetical protein
MMEQFVEIVNITFLVSINSEKMGTHATVSLPSVSDVRYLLSVGISGSFWHGQAI